MKNKILELWKIYKGPAGWAILAFVFLTYIMLCWGRNAGRYDKERESNKIVSTEISK